MMMRVLKVFLLALALLQVQMTLAEEEDDLDLGEKDENDKNEDDEFDPSQIARSGSVPSAEEVDADKDGFTTVTEIWEYLSKSFTGQTLDYAKKVTEKYFAEHDDNKDGKLDYTEYIAYRKTLYKHDWETGEL
eukprot:TRINITY_DN4835_c0_g1_i1.p1 TRINITY_DN4835_c0_g1~~TRINITY_DN4835_c0_g1_i1.p1  ORF type:complete len:133 (+),score=31.39 TRINITY_DN4835_c0_g1_i1:110-508(+)